MIINMDMMVAEEARVSGEIDNEHKAAVAYGDAEPEAISGPDDKFQRAIAAWRSAYNTSFGLLNDLLMLSQALTYLHSYQSSTLPLLKSLHTNAIL